MEFTHEIWARQTGSLRERHVGYFTSREDAEARAEYLNLTVGTREMGQWRYSVRSLGLARVADALDALHAGWS